MLNTMFKKLLTVPSTYSSVSMAALLLRVGFGLMMMRYGLMKWNNFNDTAPDFMNFLGLGGHISLGLAVFAEFFCALLVTIGLTTRLALVPLIITMLVALLVAHAGDPFDQKEHPLVFLVAYLSIMAIGPGKYSIDALFLKAS